MAVRELYLDALVGHERPFKTTKSSTMNLYDSCFIELHMKIVLCLNKLFLQGKN